ncbi:MAG: type IV toxin-antitoxin system AbiEi family antitoxin domain-containing protein [Prolixibacteraceae bacterium]
MAYDLIILAEIASIIEKKSIICAEIANFKEILKDMDWLKNLGVVPIDFGTLAAMLGHYNYPKDKITAFEKSGKLVRLKKGFYVVSPEFQNEPVVKELIANHLYGPSYVSFESALSFYGLIPEKVYTVRSATPKRSKKFTTPLGGFEYVSVEEHYYRVGIRQEITGNKYAFLIATPEKALCDLIIATPHLRIQSVKSMKVYLEEDLRIDITSVQNFDKEIIANCIQTGKKKMELSNLFKLIEK